MKALSRQTCAEHADRHAQAACMSCRKLLCQECTTQWEGINYCRSCVGTLAATTEKPRGRLGMTLMLALSVAMALALVRIAVGIGVMFAELF